MEAAMSAMPHSHHRGRVPPAARPGGDPSRSRRCPIRDGQRVLQNNKTKENEGTTVTLLPPTQWATPPRRRATDRTYAAGYLAAAVVSRVTSPALSAVSAAARWPTPGVHTAPGGGPGQRATRWRRRPCRAGRRAQSTPPLSPSLYRPSSSAAAAASSAIATGSVRRPRHCRPFPLAKDGGGGGGGRGSRGGGSGGGMVGHERRGYPPPAPYHSVASSTNSVGRQVFGSTAMPSGCSAAAPPVRLAPTWPPCGAVQRCASAACTTRRTAARWCTVSPTPTGTGHTAQPGRCKQFVRDAGKKWTGTHLPRDGLPQGQLRDHRQAATCLAAGAGDEPIRGRFRTITPTVATPLAGMSTQVNSTRDRMWYGRLPTRCQRRPRPAVPQTPRRCAATAAASGGPAATRRPARRPPRHRRRPPGVTSRTPGSRSGRS